ncbi:MAG: hypothetical protein WC697_03140 [Patescibacteria group bacterium]|jgi:hypothetical protein
MKSGIINVSQRGETIKGDVGKPSLLLKFDDTLLYLEKNRPVFKPDQTPEEMLKTVVDFFHTAMKDLERLEKDDVWNRNEWLVLIKRWAYLDSGQIDIIRNKILPVIEQCNTNIEEQALTINGITICIPKIKGLTWDSIWDAWEKLVLIEKCLCIVLIMDKHPLFKVVLQEIHKIKKVIDLKCKWMRIFLGRDEVNHIVEKKDGVGENKWTVVLTENAKIEMRKIGFSQRDINTLVPLLEPILEKMFSYGCGGNYSSWLADCPLK